MLGAPLTNFRWSWGAVRSADGAVFLRVWEDHIRTQDGTQFAQLTYHARFRDHPVNPGHRERLEHVARIREGATCYLILCRAVDATVRPRRIGWFNAAEVFPGGRIVESGGECWVEMLPGVDIREATL